jgi:hypothetical protein
VKKSAANDGLLKGSKGVRRAPACQSNTSVPKHTSAAAKNHLARDKAARRVFGASSVLGLMLDSMSRATHDVGRRFT